MRKAVSIGIGVKVQVYNTCPNFTIDLSVSFYGSRWVQRDAPYLLNKAAEQKNIDVQCVANSLVGLNGQKQMERFKKLTYRISEYQRNSNTDIHLFLREGDICLI